MIRCHRNERHGCTVDLGLPDLTPQEAAARGVETMTAKETSLPCCDPIRFGVGKIVDNLLRQ